MTWFGLIQTMLRHGQLAPEEPVSSSKYAYRWIPVLTSVPGWLFGDKVADEFCHVNDLTLIARAHQLVNEGYKYHFTNNNVVTVWSAPNYCYRCGNLASVCEIGEDLNPKFKLFSAVSDDQRHVPQSRGGRSEYFL